MARTSSNAKASTGRTARTSKTNARTSTRTEASKETSKKSTKRCGTTRCCS